METEEQKKPDTEEGTNLPDVDKWRKKLKRSETKLAAWRKESKSYYEIYEGGKASGEDMGDLGHFNIFFSNTETLRANVYNQEPTPRVSDRFKSGKPLTSLGAEILERAISFTVEDAEMSEMMKPVVTDSLVAEFGLARVRYTPHMIQKPVVDEITNEPKVDEKGDAVTEDTIGFQTISLEMVDYDKVLWDPQRRWEKVGWVAFEHQFTEDEFPQFDVEKEAVTFKDYEVSGSDEKERKCTAYEVWDKEGKQVFFLFDGHDKPLNVIPDPLGLDQFFPCPKPIQFLKRNASTVPNPEYNLYRKPAEKLAKAAARKAAIINYVKAVGVYDKSSKEIAGLLKADDGEMLPADMNMMGDGGTQPTIGKSFELLPVEGFARVLAQLELTITETKQIVYEVTGISDIMRGQSVASESATAQRIKGNFGTLRLQERQKEVARFVRDLIRLIGEIIAEHYEPQVLQMMTGMNLPATAADAAAAAAQPVVGPDGTPLPPKPPQPSWEEVMAMLRDQSVRTFSMGIEDNSTIAPDEEAEKKNVTDMLTGITNFLTGIGPIVASGAMPIEAAKELLLMAVRTFKGSRAAEEAINKIQAPTPPPAPAPGPLQPMRSPMQ